MKHHPITSQQEPKQSEEPGEGRRENDSDPKRDPERIERIESRPQKEEIDNPDIVYKDLQIDLDLFEWIIVGIIAIIFIVVSR